MKRHTDEELYKRFIARMRAVEKGGEEKDILDALSSGHNSYMRLDRLESSSYDPSWIDMIEGVLFDLGDIINVPRINTKTVGDVSPIELAKKITGESVQHLASHTQYIKEVDDYGNVIPSKIMSFSNEDDYLTYENRFIATFIRKLILFVEKRYEFVQKFAQLHDEEVLYIKNRSEVRGADVSIETRIKVVSASETTQAKENNAYFRRISEVRRYLLYYYGSPFMKMFKTEKNVRNPILQTNIIRKNVKYHHCYEVYRYIERFEHLGVSYQIDEDYSLFTDEELRELNYSLLASYLSLRGKKKSGEIKSNSKIYKPRILTSIDDESFLYHDYLKGPIEFVRADKGYRDFLGRLEPKDLPENPTEAEKGYFKEDYEAKSDLAEFDKELAELLKRKAEEGASFETEINEILAKRDEEKKRLEALELEIVNKEQEDLLNRIRAEIVRSAESYRDEYVPYMPDPEESAKRMDEAMEPALDGESILRDPNKTFPYRDSMTPYQLSEEEKAAQAALEARRKEEMQLKLEEEALREELADLDSYIEQAEDEQKTPEEIQQELLDKQASSVIEEIKALEEGEVGLVEEEPQEGELAAEEESAEGEQPSEESASIDAMKEPSGEESIEGKQPEEELSPTEEESIEQAPKEELASVEAAGEESAEGEQPAEGELPPAEEQPTEEQPASVEVAEEPAPSAEKQPAGEEQTAGEEQPASVEAAEEPAPSAEEQPAGEGEPASEEAIGEESAEGEQPAEGELPPAEEQPTEEQPASVEAAGEGIVPTEEGQLGEEEATGEEQVTSVEASSEEEPHEIPEEEPGLPDIEEHIEDIPEHEPSEEKIEKPEIPGGFVAPIGIDIQDMDEGAKEKGRAKKRERKPFTLRDRPNVKLRRKKEE